MYKIKLSPYSKIFYTEWLLNPDSSNYNLVIDQILYGNLDVGKLRAALKRYIVEYVILNSHIQEIDGETYWIKNTSISKLEYINGQINDAELLHYVSSSFDLRTGPLYRFRLVQINKNTHRLILVFHHIIVDGSVALDSGVFEAISNYYNDENYSIVQSIDDQIKAISDLTDKLSANLAQNKEKYKEFWIKQLSEIESIDLDFLKTHKEINKRNIKEINFSYNDLVISKLNKLKSKYGITPYAYGQCILALLLHRYTGQNRLAISYPVAIKEGIDFIYGAQINTNIIPYQFDENTTIINLFNQNKEFFDLTVRNDIKNGYYPISNLIQNGANKSLLNICFAQTFFRENPFYFNGITKVELSTELSVDGVAKDILLFEHDARDNKLNYRVRYDKNSFDEELINNLITYYKKLFLEVSEDLLSGNNKKIVDYTLLDLEQYQQIIYDFNKTQVDYPHDKTIHELFEEQALKTPDNIAVVYDDIKLTYRELNNKANQLANYLLQNYDIKPDDLIALCLDRNEYMLIAMLGVLKTGSAYVPIDPSYPNERIKYILNDTKTKVILINDAYIKKIWNIIKNGIAIIGLDNKDVQLKLNKQKITNPATKITSDNLIYIIYTSGTTGDPKGVLIEHHSVVNYVMYLISYNGISNKSIGSQYASFNFDAFVIEAYPILLSGGTLYIMSEQDKLDPIKINDFFNEYRITYAFLPTKIAEVFFNLKNNYLINLVVGGEKLEKFIKQTYRIMNAYGPTEATVQVTNFVVDDFYKNIPIGAPINNVKCHIVDTKLNILPIGAIGELVIGGECLARGYLNNKTLTTGKFIFNPFQTKEEKKQNKNNSLYKTGDLARMLPSGNLEYMGRNDLQVKIRGYRIELGEIEYKLLGYSGIKQAIALAKEQRLLAYYVADKKLGEEEIKAYLATQLPEYMLPYILIHINKLPLTINGKLDKKALPEPKLTNLAEYIAPRNELEKKVCEIYAKILNLPIQQVGINSDFFRMGGDSISSIQIASQIRQYLKLNINVKDVFSYRSIEQLIINVLVNQKVQKENTINLKYEDHPIGRFSLLPIQGWFFDNVKANFYPKFNHWNQAFVIKTPELDANLLKLSIEKLLEYHDAFRLRFKYFHQYYIEVDLAKESENIEKINVATISTEELEKRLTKIQSNFNIETGPVYVVAYLYGYEDNTARLFFALHHLIVDSVSWRILAHDVGTLYRLLQNKNNINKATQELLGKKGASYRQWVDEISTYKPSNKELNYWNEIVKNYIYIPKNANKRMINSEFSLTAQLTQNLLTKVNETYHTQINDILLSALARTLAEIFVSQTNYITLEGHGREEINPEIDITRTLGWFTIIYPVRLVNHNAIADLIKATKENLNNIPNKGIGYGAIKGYQNIPSISFNYLGQINSAENFWDIVNHIISIASENKSSNVVDIYGYIANGILKFYISSHDNDFASVFKLNLEKIIEHCLSSSRTYLTSSDINGIISQEYLDKIQKNTEVDSVYLANNLQQGMIYHAIRQGKTDDAYLSQFTWKYTIPIDEKKFKRAWQLVQRKYPSLRLRFAWGEELIQIIDNNQELHFKYIDLTKLDKATYFKRQLQIVKIISQDREQQYDLQKGNLIRVYLIKVLEDDYSCICSHHHIILDGWSLSLLIDSMHEIYSQLLKNNQPQIVEDITYKEAQKYLQEYKNEDREYINNNIKFIESRLDLRFLLKPSIRNVEIKNHTQIVQEQEQCIEIAEQKLINLKNICRENAVTISAVIQYVWHKILHMVDGFSDTTVVGTTVSGRSLPIENIENSVGLFINTLPLIFAHNKELNIIEQLKVIQNSINEINIRSNVNLADIQTNGERLFDSLLVYENHPSVKNTTDVQYEMEEEIFKVDYPLAITVCEKNHIIEIRLKYAGELFDQDTISYFLDKMLFFIEQVSKNPYKKTLNYLNQEEYQRLIIDYNKTDKSYPINKTIHNLFEEQVVKTPNNIALVYENKKLTYRELNTKANQLANYILKNNNIRPDDLITLMLNRSEYTIISILAVLKTGAAYVPIDTKYPSEIINHILQDTKAKVIIRESDVSYKTQDKHIIEIDSEEFQKVLSKEDVTNPKTNVSSTDLIYVLYTSGTTGNPKGVMLEHAGCVNRLLEMIRISQIMEHNKVLFKTNYVFDVSFSDIFATLLSGASLFVTKENFDIEEIEIKIKKYSIDVCHFTPSQFDAIKDIKGAGLFKAFKILHFSGEALNIESLTDLDKNIKCINYYGPTEAGEVTFDVCTSFNSMRPLIGYPISNVKLFILDKNLIPLPVGAVGELYLGGMCLARGYLNQAELTKERFISNPFQTGRIYKTGDLVRMLPNGNIEYRGRNDFQVKIRGHRIELGEIEKKLISYPEINQAIVVVEENNSNKYLVGYYVADKKLDERKIKNYLLERLSDYMVPSVFVHLLKLPLTKNGKLDKEALPKLVFTRKDNYVAPKSKQEKLVCKEFANVLGLQKVGINDDFFSLGGNSIQAIKLTSILQANFDIRIIDVFNLRTPKKIAKSSVFGKNFLQRKLEMVKYAYKNRVSSDGYINKKPQYLNSYENLQINVFVKKSIRNVLLTGSTGYLGCNILNQLLELTDYKIYLVVRADSQLAATERVNKKYQFYFDKTLNDAIGSRVFIIKADIEKNYLGLLQGEYQVLVAKIDSVIHAAALVKHYGEYDKFYSANVGATINLLEFTKSTKLKDFHYISTIGVLYFVGTLTKQYVCTEDDLPNNAEILNNNYAQTKLQGEQQVIKYRDHGVSCNIYRVGNLAFIGKNCRAQENIEDNAFYVWLKCLFTIKSGAEIFNSVEISQVDLTAQSIVKIFDKKNISNQVHHVFNPYLFNMNDIFKDNNCEILPIESFIDCIEQHIKNGDYHDLIIRFLLYNGWLDWWDERNVMPVKILQNKTQYILKQLNFEWMPITNKAIYNYLDNLKILGDVPMKKNAKIFSELENFVSIIPVPVAWFDIDGAVLGGNDLVFKAVGANSIRKLIIGKMPHEYYPADVADIVLKNMKQVMTEKKSLEFEESVRDIETEKMKYFLAIRAPLFDDNGIDVVGTIVTSVDITDRKEKEQLQIENELQKSKLHEQESIANITAQVSHDIRSPIASLDMVLASCKEIPEAKRISLRTAMTRITDIANNLLAEQRKYEASKDLESEPLQPILISLAVAELLSLKRAQYGRLPIIFNSHVDAQSSFAFIRTDPSNFGRMLSNLVNNSIDAFEDKEGIVDIDLAIEEQQAKIIIQDNGKGMTQEVLNKIMNNITVTAGKSHGNGIGMTQVRSALHTSNGKMQIESEIGIGTKFTLTFPIVSAPDWIADKIVLYKGDTIVILDDDHSIHDAWNIRFENYADLVTLRHFEDGEKVMEFINNSPEKSKIVLLADFELIGQKLNGLEIIEQVAIPQRPILVTSHYNKQKVRDLAANAEIKILPKQLAVDVLVDIKDRERGESAIDSFKKIDLVIVDDDQFYVDCLADSLKDNFAIETYYHPKRFLENLSRYSKDTRICLDNDFKASIDGIEVAKQLNQAGYTKLYLLSGRQFEKGEVPDYLTLILKGEIDMVNKLRRAVAEES